MVLGAHSVSCFPNSNENQRRLSIFMRIFARTVSLSLLFRCVGLKISGDPARSSSGHWTGSGSGGSADSCSSAHTSVESESPQKILAWTSQAGARPAVDAHADDIPFMDDEESSSVYSCDTEGYYTSFHVDTGISKPSNKFMQQLHSQIQSQYQNQGQQSGAVTSPRTAGDRDYEAFGRGSNSTNNTSDSVLTVVPNGHLVRTKNIQR